MDTLFEALCQPTTGVRLLWTGNDGWLLWNGSKLIGVDLDFTNPLRKAPPFVDPSTVAQKLQLHFISHEHEDHFSSNTCRLLSEQGDCQFIIPQSRAKKAVETKLSPKRYRLVSPGDHFIISNTEISCIRAIHGHIGGSVYSNATPLDCGYRFQFGGLQFYQPGDTLLLEEHISMEPVDILFISPTEHNTWIENSQKLIALLNPKWILAQHFGTYRETCRNQFWAHGYIEELYAALPPHLQKKFYVPEQTSIIELMR